MISPVEQIKERLSIVDVVSSYVKLEKAGTYFKARCPFHNEKTASFFVSPGRGTYHCFGCAKGGDIFTFTEEIEGFDFSHALTYLAEKAGVTLVRESDSEKTKRSKLYSVMNEAALFYEKNRKNNADVNKYLYDRGLSEDTLVLFSVGYALPNWDSLVKYLRSKGYDENTMEEVGLVLKSEHGYIDRFRGRIMFPITDSQGRTVAFTGRIFVPPNTKEPENVGKYVNSPETVLYNKSRILYGYSKAKQAILRQGYVVVVEGQVDLLAAVQAGTENIVAVSGTAMTKDHLDLLNRFTDKIYFSFDSDNAGLKAGARGIELAIELGLEVKLLTLPKGDDPASLIKDKGVDAWQEIIKSAKHPVDFFLESIIENTKDERDRLKRVKNEVIPYLVMIGSDLERGHFIQKMSQALNAKEDDIRSEVESLLKNKNKDKVSANTVLVQKISVKSNKDRIVDRLMGIYIMGKIRKDVRVDIGELETEWQRILVTSLSEELDKIPENKREDILFESDIFYQTKESLKDDIKILCLELEKVLLEERFQALLIVLKKSEIDKDSVLALETLGECQKISKRIDEIKSQL
ncbi:DNA primase [Candidatus Nomurabacteria bacterium]|nr:MAG: DNA primase [Candidatus Nomurabacteria bacterium]